MSDVPCSDNFHPDLATRESKLFSPAPPVELFRRDFRQHGLHKLRQGRLVKLRQHVLELCRVRFARSEVRTVYFPQRAYESIAVLSAQLAVLVAMAVIDAHEVP